MTALAQSSSAAGDAPSVATPAPEAPARQSADNQLDGRIYGKVTDPSGNVIAGAKVSLAAESAGSQRSGLWPIAPGQSLLTDSAGSFQFSKLHAGKFRIAVQAQGFADWIGPAIMLSAGQYYDVPEIALQVAAANTNVEVVVSPYEVAEEQIQDEERQRILGVVPNFYTSYVWHAAPMTSGQKFRLAARTAVDPVTFGIDAATAGIEQSQNAFSGYGGGGEGYAKRFGASYADDVIGTFVAGAILPSILHQDPRYFYKGTGSVASRALYAVSTVVICRGDDGRWEPNYSNIAGTLISAGISNLYYPASNRNGAGETIDNALISTAEGAAGALLQEFVLKKLSRGVPHQPTAGASATAEKID